MSMTLSMFVPIMRIGRQYDQASGEPVGYRLIRVGFLGGHREDPFLLEAVL